MFSSLTRGIIRRAVSNHIKKNIKYSTQTANQLVEALQPLEESTYLDLTFGSGHHTKHLLETCNCNVFGLDCDVKVSPIMDEVFKKFPARFSSEIGRFSQLGDIVSRERRFKTPIQGIILDIGVSDLQFEDKRRGFDIFQNGHLDMRMDSSLKITAAQIVQHGSKEDMSRIFRKYGGVKRSKQIASDIIEAKYMLKKLETVRDFRLFLLESHERIQYFVDQGVEEIEENVGRIFEALRRFVNDELNELDFVLRFAEKILKPGCVLAIITKSPIEESLLNRYLFKEVSQDHENNCKTFMWKVMSKNIISDSGKLFVVKKLDMK